MFGSGNALTMEVYTLEVYKANRPLFNKGKTHISVKVMIVCLADVQHEHKCVAAKILKTAQAISIASGMIKNRSSCRIARYAQLKFLDFAPKANMRTAGNNDLWAATLARQAERA